MSLALTIVFFLLGLIIGSFLNVVICRYNTARSFGGRSMCLSCSEEIDWHDLVPLFSFLVLRGRCRSCQSKISWQYPLVEFITGIIFALLFWKFEYLFWSGAWLFALHLAFYAAAFSLALVIAVYDLKHKIIPDVVVFVFGALAFLGLFLFQAGFFLPHWPSLWDMSVGIFAALPFAALWFLSRGTWMGLGDAKLMLGLGWLLGAQNTVFALFIAFGLGFLVGVAMLIVSKKYHLRSEIPFAPFLVLGAFLAFIFEHELAAFISYF